MRIVIALGGNALLRRGEPLTAENQRLNVRIACEQIAKIYPNNELVIAHGNGPQVGLLALQGAAYKEVPPYPLDVLGAESVGMIGYMIQQELGNLVPFEVPFATLLSQVEVDINDPAFKNPTKPIGPVYTKEERHLPSRFIAELPRECIQEIRLRGTVTRAMNLAKVGSLSNTSAVENEWKMGQKVKHEKFGFGTVINVEGADNNLRLQIAFQNQGIKWLIAHLAKLERL